MESNRQERRLSAILSADVVGFSAMVGHDEAGTIGALKSLRQEVIDPRVARHQGRTIKLMGDGSLIEFASAVDAVEFAVDVQRALAARQADVPEYAQIRFRIGINVGDIIVDGEDIYGAGVNIAARIEALAEPGGICVSKTVHDHVDGKVDLRFEALGPQSVKNIAKPVEVYRVVPEMVSGKTGAAVVASLPGQRRRGRLFAVLAAVCVGLAAALVWYMSRPAMGEPPVIAVLPFHDVSPEEHRGLLSDPLSDGILAHLARYPELTVIARGSSFRYRNGDRDLREIGAQLDADYLLEGSLNFDGKRVAVNTALVDVSENAQAWTDQITIDIDDLMAGVADIGQRVAYQVEDYVGQARVADAGPFKADALLMTMRARRATMLGLSQERNAENIALNQRTIDLYPDQAWGHLSMAFALRTQVRFGWAEDPEAVLARAAEHGETAVRLDPQNYSAYFALGRVRMQQGQHDRAIESFETALTLNPSSADTLNALAQVHFYRGENELAIAILDRSARIDPLPSFVHSWVSAWVLWQDGQCEAARAAFSRIASPPAEAQKLGSVIETCLGNTDAAQAALASFLEAKPDWTARDEVTLQEGVWTYAPGRDRWIEALLQAGLPRG